MKKIISGFEPLDNPNTKLWRYMDFTKFISMLEYGGLYFPRADKLGDPFEGSWRKPFPLSPATIGPLMVGGIELPAVLGRDVFRAFREYVVISCWHMNEYESDAMWSRYGGSNGAVAVQTRYALLRKSLPADFRLGRVSYVDFTPPPEVAPDGDGAHQLLNDFLSRLTATDQLTFPEMRRNYHFWLYAYDLLGRDTLQRFGIDSEGELAAMLLSVFLQKRKPFQHEQELRAVALLLDIGSATELPIGPDNLPHPTIAGIWQPLNLSQLIEHVYVAPGARDAFVELLERMLHRYQLSVPVHRTSMDATPIF